MPSVKAVSSSYIPPEKEIKKELRAIDKAQEKLFKQVTQDKITPAQAHTQLANIGSQYSNLSSKLQSPTAYQKGKLYFLDTKINLIRNLITDPAYKASFKKTHSPKPSRASQIVTKTKQIMKSIIEKCKKEHPVDKIPTNAPLETYLKAIVPLEHAGNKPSTGLPALKAQTKKLIAEQLPTTTSVNESHRKRQYAEFYFEFIKMHRVIHQLRECITATDPVHASKLIKVMGLSEAENELAHIISTISKDSPRLQLLTTTMTASTMQHAPIHLELNTFDVETFQTCTKQLAYVFRLLPLLDEVNTKKLTKNHTDILIQTASAITSRTPNSLLTTPQKELVKLVFNNPKLRAQFVQFATRIPQLLTEIAQNSPESDRERFIELIYESKLNAMRHNLIAENSPIPSRYSP